MASDIKTTSEDADMAECDGEKVVTMMDVLQEQEDFEEDANAVLGASDEKECTYSKGYIKRQAIYACMTCCPEARSDPSKRAGVCLACSLMCHENHELVELYTKRNFRCDCGNPKFNSHPCTFTPDKTDLNEDNYYNQNFSGLYCTCQRPYPDPESTVEDEMIQCIICEDWLHASHLESTVPGNEQYSEMICKMCMEKNEFLHDYSELAVNVDNVEVDVVQINGKDAHNPTLCNGDAKAETNDSTLSENVKTDVEMEEKPEQNVAATETSTLESKESENESKDETVSKDEGDINDKKDESMETNQTEQVQPSDATSEEASVTANEEPSEKTDQESTESENKLESIPKTDDIPKDGSDEPTTDKIENSSDTTTPADQSENNESKEQENSEETNQQNEAPSNEAEQTKTLTEEEIKANEQKAEKMEEDKLLADPEDSNEKTEPSEENKNTTDNVTSNDNVENEKEEPKSEIVSNEDSENPKPEEKLDSEVPEKTVNENDSNIDNTSETNPSTSNESSSENKPENVTEEERNTAASTVENESTKKESSKSEKISEKRKHVEETSDTKEAKKQKLDNVCVRPKGEKKIYKGATFWPSNFRQKLCTCQECISMYNDLSVLFLTDPEDTVTAYENLGKQKINGKPTTQYERGLQALSSLDRIQQINALTEYNRMRDRLLDFLKSFKDRKEIVKEEDIKAFFAGMRPKREPDGVYFCR